LGHFLAHSVYCLLLFDGVVFHCRVVYYMVFGKKRGYAELLLVSLTNYFACQCTSAEKNSFLIMKLISKYLICNKIVSYKNNLSDFWLSSGVRAVLVVVRLDMTSFCMVFGADRQLLRFGSFSRRCRCRHRGIIRWRAIFNY